MLKTIFNLEAILLDNYREMNEASIKLLEESILTIGLQEPILLFYAEDTGNYHLVSGHHRLAAMKRIKKLAGHEKDSFVGEVIRGSSKEFQSQGIQLKAILSNCLRKEPSLKDLVAAIGRLRSKISNESLPKVLGLSQNRFLVLCHVCDLKPEDLAQLFSYEDLPEKVLIDAAVKKRDDETFALNEHLARKRKETKKRAKPPLTKRLVQSRLKKTGDFSSKQIKLIIDALEDRLQ